MSSCVQTEQNELVVRTGLELRLRQLDSAKVAGRSVVWIGTLDSCKKLADKMTVPDTTQHIFRTSILDLPKEFRPISIIICFDEPSYNGRQCLYHLFGEKHGLQSYQNFVDAIEQTQKDGDAIVFTGEEVMWFPGPNSEPIKTTESDTKSQLVVIAESLKTLTEAVNKLVSSS